MNETKTRNERRQIRIHFMMALCGGFFGVYAILSRMNNLGQAQTANLIELICDLLGRDLADALERFLAFLIFAAAMILATVLEKRTDWDLRLPAVFLDMAAAIAIGFIPAKADPVVALYPVFAATAFQWCVFKSAGGYAASTIFCTNNLRQTVVSLTEYLLLSREERKGGGETLKKACMFGGTLASFYSGVLIGGILWHLTGVRSIWFNLLLLSCSALLIGAARRPPGCLPGRDSDPDSPVDEGRAFIQTARRGSAG